MKPVVRKEKEMYAPALRFLNNQPGTKAWLNWNNAIYMPGVGFKRKANHEDGIPDIIGVKKKSFGSISYGQIYAFELKRKGCLKNVSQAQRLWLERFHLGGGIGYVVDSIEDLIEAFGEV